MKNKKAKNSQRCRGAITKRREREESTKYFGHVEAAHRASWTLALTWLSVFMFSVMFLTFNYKPIVSLTAAFIKQPLLNKLSSCFPATAVWCQWAQWNRAQGEQREQTAQRVLHQRRAWGAWQRVLLLQSMKVRAAATLSCLLPSSPLGTRESLATSLGKAWDVTYQPYVTVLKLSYISHIH